MNFASVKGIAIPQGNVSKLSIDGVDVWSAARLPSGYQEVEYLESTGTQYIDTRIICGAVDRDSIETSIDFVFLGSGDPSSEGAIFGGKGTTTYSATMFWSKSDNVVKIWCDTGTTLSSGVAMSVGNRYSVQAQYFYPSGKKLKVNDKIVESSSSNLSLRSNFTGTYVFFADGSRPASFAKVKIYSAVLSINGIQERNLVPCIRKSDNKPGMYDLCGSICPLTITPFYVNAGTGEFITGELV